MTKQGARRKWSARELLDAKQPVEHSTPICTVSAIADELAEAQKTLGDLERRKRLGVAGEDVDDELIVAQVTVDEAQAKYDEHAVWFTFRAVGRERLDELMREHRPTAQQVADFKRDLKLAQIPGSANAQLPYNTETLPPVLISEAAVEPKFTIEEARELWMSDAWSQGETAMILQAAWSVNTMVK